MFDFTKTESAVQLNKHFVLNRISDSMIFGYYFGSFELGKVYPSRFRRDKRASTGFYVNRSGKLVYNDFKLRESLDCFAFVQKLYNLSFADTIYRISKDFGLISGERSDMAVKVMKRLKNFDKNFKKDTKIHFSASDWNEDNLAFWKEYHITEEELIKEKIYPIKDLFINEFKVAESVDHKYALTMMHNGEMLTKVYAPHSSNFKWVTNIPLDVPFGLDTLKSGDTSFTTKAKKDKIIIQKFLTNVIASQNETLSSMVEKTRNKLKFNYMRNYVGWDNDETGLKGMDDMGQHGFIPVFVPVEYFEQGIKDFSDLAKVHGLGAVEELLKQNKVI